MYVRDLEGNEYPAQLTTTWDGELNGNQSLSATVIPSAINLRFINDLTRLWRIIDDDDTEYRVMLCRREGSGKLMKAEIKAMPKFFDDFDTQRIYERYDRSIPAQEAFTIIFRDSGYNFVLVDSFFAVDWEGFGAKDTRLETFKRALNRYGAEFRIVGNTIYLHKQIGNDTSIRYEHRLNASNIQQEIDASGFWTFAEGYGDFDEGDEENAKLRRSYTSPLAQIPSIGIRHAPPIVNGTIKTNATMDEQLKTLVDESLKISVSANIHDLTKQGYPIAQAQLGDRVFLIDRRIGFDEEVRVVAKSVTKDWKGNIIGMLLTFGTPGLAKRHQAKLNSAANKINQLLEGNLKVPFSVLPDAKQNAIRMLEQAQTELIFGNSQNGVQGIIAQDKRDSNRLMWLNSNGWMISTDGGGTTTAAATADGIVADVIYTGVLNADRVSIRGGNGVSYTFIQGPLIESAGRYTRKWRDETTTSEVKLRFINGYIQARNDTKNQSLYFSDNGISTYMDAQGEVGSSGTLEFRDIQYSSAGGVTLHSSSGVVALKSDFNRVVLDASQTVSIESAEASIYFLPMRDNRPGTNHFRMWVKDNPTSSETDGVLSYGTPANGMSSGLRFKKNISGDPIIYATNGVGDMGTGSFHAVNYFTTSSREYKKNIEDYTGNAMEKIMSTPVRWFHMKSDIDEVDPKRIGLIVQESPWEIVNLNGGDSIINDAKTSLMWKGMQEQQEEIQQLKRRMERLENAS